MQQPGVHLYDLSAAAALSAPAGEYPLTLHVTADGGFDAEDEDWAKANAWADRVCAKWSGRSSETA